MRYGIFSDVHSNLEALDAVIEAYKEEGIDKYICIGDVVGYGANPRECIERVSSLSSFSVSGNHDWAAVNLFSLDYFNQFARDAIIWTQKQLADKNRDFLEALKLVYQNQDLTLVHGTLNSPQDFDYMTNGYIAEETFRLLKTNVCFLGHTHVAGVFIKDRQEEIVYREDDFFSIEKDNQYIINVGSVGQPRNGNPRSSYCIYDTLKMEVRINRADYNIEVARDKIFAAGLPKYLGDRLMLGR